MTAVMQTANEGSPRAIVRTARRSLLCPAKGRGLNDAVVPASKGPKALAYDKLAASHHKPEGIAARLPILPLGAAIWSD